MAELVGAYRDYVQRQIGKMEHCADLRGVGGTVPEWKTMLARIARLAGKYDIPAIDEAKLTPRFAPELPGAQPSRSMLQDAGKLVELATALRNGGSGEVKARLELLIQGLAGADPDPQSPAFDLAARAGMLTAVIGRLKDDQVTALAMPALFRITENPKLREVEPAAWVVVVRGILDLARHPSLTVSGPVGEALRATRDPELALYAASIALFGRGGEYHEDPLSPAVLTSY